MNSPATYFKVQNNARDVTNDASGSILADIEGEHPILHLRKDLKIKGKKWMKTVFLDL